MAKKAVRLLELFPAPVKISIQDNSRSGIRIMDVENFLLHRKILSLECSIKHKDTRPIREQHHDGPISCLIRFVGGAIIRQRLRV